MIAVYGCVTCVLGTAQFTAAITKLERCAEVTVQYTVINVPLITVVKPRLYITRSYPLNWLSAV